MVLVYLPTWLGDLSWANVGKYTSTMEHMGVIRCNKHWPIPRHCIRNPGMSEAKIASMAIFGGTPKGPQGKELKKRCPQARRDKNSEFTTGRGVFHDWWNSSDILRLVKNAIVRALIKYNWLIYHKSLLPRYLTIKYFKNWLIYQLYLLPAIITGFLYHI